jgi:hypothetical protein
MLSAISQTPAAAAIAIHRLDSNPIKGFWNATTLLISDFLIR